MSTLQLKAVSLTGSEGTQIVTDADFSVPDGGFCVLVGPSGAGKTSIMETIAGLRNPTSGSVLIDGQDQLGIRPEDRDVAMCFENYVLYPHFSVQENIAFPLNAPNRRGQLSKAEIRERIDEVVQTLEIAHLIDRKPSQLSGGQRQRVSLARALVRRPRVLLLDEPISHLDAKLRHAMRTELRRIQQQLGVTTIYATPDQADALALGDIAVVLDKGQCLQVGPPDELYRRPAHVRVAEILGDVRINMLPAQMAAGHLQVLDQQLHSPDVGDGAALVAIRPSDITLHAAGSSEYHGGAASMFGEVVLRQPLGYATALYVDIADQMIRVLEDGRSKLQVADRVLVDLTRSQPMIFDAGTNQMLADKEQVSWQA